MRQNVSHYKDMLMNMQIATAQCAWKVATAQCAWDLPLLLHLLAQQTLHHSTSINLTIYKPGRRV